MTPDPIISLHDVTRVYEPAGVRALDGVSLDVESGTIVSIVGASGSGKSTLLNVIGGIDAVTSGSVLVSGHDITRAGDRETVLVRRKLIGIIFQFFNLMPTLTVLENVALPAELAGTSRAEAHARARELLEHVGMTGRAGHRPHELSGGEMQRTAIARALVNNPAVLLADEPTGNLDTRNGVAVLGLLRRIARERAATLLIATHDPAVAGAADRTVTMSDGRVEADGATEHAS